MPTAATTDARFRLEADVARRLAAEFGTPLYVLDEAHFRARIREWRAAFPGEITFASKANSTLAALRIAYSEGCGIDVASEGELRAAMAAGVPASACHLHGNNKKREEIQFALLSGIGLIVADAFEELELLAELGCRAPIALRLAPGVDPITNAKISTGQADTKFGFNIADGSAMRAVTRCGELGLNLIGFHCHVGSQLLDPEAQIAGGRAIATFAKDSGIDVKYLNVGGGLGVRYGEGDSPLPIPEYCRAVAQAVREIIGDAPILAAEPGRSLIAESGVTLYRVGVVKETPVRTFVSVDGGLADNPRPAMYGARYPIEVIAGEPRGTWDYEVDGPGAAFGTPRMKTVTISGRHCETDTLFPDVEVPADIAAGDLVQVLVTGAYNSSMASNYNRYPRPATVLIRSTGAPELVQSRETFDQMLAREILPEGL